MHVIVDGLVHGVTDGVEEDGVWSGGMCVQVKATLLQSGCGLCQCKVRIITDAWMKGSSNVGCM